MNRLIRSSSLIKAARIEKSRRSFWFFCILYDPEFFSKLPFLQEVAEAFQFVHDEYVKGNAITESISMPPRAGKSYITTLFCAWWLGKFPELSVMRNTCTATLYQKFSYDVRNIVKSEKYREVFPFVQLADDKQNLGGWNLKQSKQVGYFGNGVGGTIIGFGANIAITDDLYRDIEDAMSEGYNEKVLRWKESAHDSRKEKNCPEILIGTRWTKNDVIGRAIEKGKVNRVISIPALDENGKSFCEDVKSTEEYQNIKNDIDETIWSAEYMQEPIEAKGLLFPEAELQTFVPDIENGSVKGVADVPFETSIGYADIADQGDDYFSAPIGRNIGKNIYIVDWEFSQENTDVSLPNTVSLIVRNGVKYFRCEANAMGAKFERDLRKEVAGRCQTYQAVSTTNKHTRIMMDAGFIKKHCYFLAPEFRSEKYKRAMDQLTKYLKNGTSKKDDSPDSMSGLVSFIQGVLRHVYNK